MRMLKKYTEYRQEHYLKKEFLSSTVKTTVNQQNSKTKVKEISESLKKIDTARSNGIKMKEILKYDLIIENYLFDGDYTRKPQNTLVKEVENLKTHY